MRQSSIPVAAILLASILGTGNPIRAEAGPAVAIVREIASPGSGEGLYPSIARGRDGSIHITWIEEMGGEEFRLRHAALDEESWTEATTIASGGRWFVNWADFPSAAALEDGTVAAHWLEMLGPGTFDYGVRLAISRDAGKTWGDPIWLHDDLSAREHGFVSLVALEDGRFGAVWLDGRKMTPEDPDDHGEMELRFRTIGAGGDRGEETLLDPRVCECCGTAAVVAGENRIVAAYRDRSPEEVRDIGVALFEKGAWSAPAVLYPDGWTIDGCPVNGPRLASRGSLVALAWFTGGPGGPAVNAAIRDLDSANSAPAPPVRIDSGDPLGRIDAALLDDGSLVVSWLERVAPAAELRLVRILPDGRPDPPVVVAEVASSRQSGIPRMVSLGRRVLVAWTDPGQTDRVRVAIVEWPPE